VKLAADTRLRQLPLREHELRSVAHQTLMHIARPMFSQFDSLVVPLFLLALASPLLPSFITAHLYAHLGMLSSTTPLSTSTSTAYRAHPLSSATVRCRRFAADAQAIESLPHGFVHPSMICTETPQAGVAMYTSSRIERGDVILSVPRAFTIDGASILQLEPALANLPLQQVRPTTGGARADWTLSPLTVTRSSLVTRITGTLRSRCSRSAAPRIIMVEPCPPAA